MQVTHERSAKELSTSNIASLDSRVSLLTGGIDRPYVYGLTGALSSLGTTIDLIGSDELDDPAIHGRPGVQFLNLRGDQRPDAKFVSKIYRILAYYLRLVRYAAKAQPKLFHILWNNKVEIFDRSMLMLYYKLLGKRIVLTAHNVNKRRRDSSDTFLNRLTLRMQYGLADHVFVHTPRMKNELIEEFGVPSHRVTVIPFGINNSVPNTNLSAGEAKERLGIRPTEQTILFFGRIKPYKGLDSLITAFETVVRQHDDFRLIIAGALEPGCEGYWESMQGKIQGHAATGRILARIEFIPDNEVEIYFKASDVLVLPYRDVFQSGVIFLGYSFGLPAIVADVGSLKDEIVQGKTGFVFEPDDQDSLARVITQYFASDLFRDLANRRREIHAYALQQHSWEAAGQIMLNTYQRLLADETRNAPGHDLSNVSFSK